MDPDRDHIEVHLPAGGLIVFQCSACRDWITVRDGTKLSYVDIPDGVSTIRLLYCQACADKRRP